MKINHKDLRRGEVKVTVENGNDLWYLSSLIESGDRLSGKTLRKIKLGESTDRNTKIIKRPVFLSIAVDKVEYSPESLRVGGAVLEGPEDVPHGSHHTFTIEENTSVMITKPKWLRFQIEKLEESAQEQGSPILMCVFDREEAYFAKLVRNGYEFLSSMRGDVRKKDEDGPAKGENFYARIIAQASEYAKRFGSSQIIMASPAFWKDELMKEVKDAGFRKMLITAMVSSVDKTSFNELVRREEVKSALRQDRFSKEMNAVDDLMKEIARGEIAAYGVEEVRHAVEAGAVATLLVTETLIARSREDGTYPALESMLRDAESAQGEVIIISSEHEGGQQLDGIGGIGAILRYRLG